MAKSSTTHVIEIETGIGEPAFIPLSMGQELQPISVGKKGMWRIESPRVLDVHAFVYFDGNSLFLQSADEQSAASVDGFRVGKAWTELHAPCNIDIGSARLRYRSLMPEDHVPTEPAAGASPGGPGGPAPRPGASIPVAVAVPPPGGQAPRMGTGQRQAAPVASNPPLVFPKADRPFRPGELSSGPDAGENTRVAPLEAAGGRVASGPQQQRPDLGTAGMQQPAGMGYPQQPPQQGFDPNLQEQLGYDPNQHHQGYDPNQHHGYPPAGSSNAGGSGSFAVMGQGGMPPIPGPPGMPQQIGVPPGRYGSMTPQGVQQPPPPAKGRLDDLVVKLKANSIPLILAGLLVIVGGVLYFARDNDPRPKKPVAALDGGAVVGGTASPTLVAPQLPVWPAGVACPPPNWPANTPLPCTPNALGQQADPLAGGKDAGKTKDPGPSFTSGGKTLERQAVDFVAAGEMAKAAAAYEELVRRDPNNKVYAEAARILRAKLDAGTQ